MIEDALTFTQKALNQFLQNRFRNQDKNVVINSVIDDDNTIPLINQNKIVLSLINVENESAKPFYNRTHNFHNGYSSNVNPPEKFNLDMLVTASFQDYLEAIKFLNSSITFFQANAAVSIRSFSFFPAHMEKLEYELVKMNYDKMFDLWSAMGAKYKPSMVYKVKLITIQSEEVITIDENIAATTQHIYPE